MNNRQNSCVLNEPYPPAKACCRNDRYAALLMQDYAGRSSEMTGIMQYLFQHLTAAECQPELADTLESIGLVEMHHMELLGETIVSLGGCPQIRGGMNDGYWSGRYPNYATDICSMLRTNIAAETEAIATYNRHIQMIDDENVRALLRRIIKDEQHHLKIFREWQQKLCGCR